MAPGQTRDRTLVVEARHAGTIACLVAGSWLACYLPSRRAAIVDPVNTLRAE